MIKFGMTRLIFIETPKNKQKTTKTKFILIDQNIYKEKEKQFTSKTKRV